MSRSKPPFFDEVRNSTLDRWSQIERDPELGGAWWLLFRQVQNPRHVLSELLQNADDAGATEASAWIRNGHFVFNHNGHDFSKDEFGSLCRFGFSNKRRLLTIGFRGIGFKSVFSLGEVAAVMTPTLAFHFNRKRFTQPEWIDDDTYLPGTNVVVKLESPDKEQAIRTQIDTWTGSAVPLLFFQSIRTLRLSDRVIQVESAGCGPSNQSVAVNLTGMEGTGIVFHSKEEPFPDGCLNEIRAERVEENLDLPPCEVAILLSALQQQRLYCVLPTEVTVSLPFSCHAPFVQDPARTGIKEPSMSPTNAWLLDRTGALAAESLLHWLRRADLSLSERAKAYGLLPALAAYNTATVSGAATQRVIDAFRKGIEHEKLLLCSDGTLESQSYAARLPQVVVDAWGPETARTLFSPTKRSVIAREVPPATRNRLHEWNLLGPPSFETIFNALTDESKPLPPRPERLETLAALWAFANENQPDPWGVSGWWRKAAIVPLAGREHLGRAYTTLPSRSRPSACTAADWEFITDRAEVLDDAWRQFIDSIKENPTEAQRILEKSLNRRLKDKELAGIVDGFRKTKLDQAPNLDQVFEQVAPRIFFGGAGEAAAAIRFVQIAAKLDVSFAASTPVKYLCLDGHWRGRSAGLLCQSTFDFQYLLPESWLSQHLISPQYEAGMQPSEVATWRKWAVHPQKGGLSAFALPVASTVTGIWNLDAAFFRARGGTVPPRRWVSVASQATDYNWDPILLEHWKHLDGSDGASIWLDVALAVISAWSAHWETVAGYQVHQERNNSRVRIDDKKSAATWLHNMQNRACVPDTYGVPRLPAELLRRTPETDALLDIEQFVLERWDTAEHQSALERLGVRTEATDASKILDRLRALARADNPPIGPLRDLYRALERVIPRLSAERVKEIVSAFSKEALIRTEGSWERSGFCFRANPGAIPGVSVLHSEIRDVIGLWAKLEIKPQPTAEDALRWFGSLPLEAPLSESDRKAAAAVLALYPLDVWTRQERWLSVQGRIARTTALKWGCLDQRAITGLFASVRGETADFSMLGHSRMYATLPNPPRLIETSLERRVLGYVPGPGSATREEPWLHALGQVLSHVEAASEDAQNLEADRRAGGRLAGTRWTPASVVHVQPYLEGAPAGSQSPMTIAWIREFLYVNGDSAHAYTALVQELLRPFQTATARGIIRDCVGREPHWIKAYAEAHVKLVDESASRTQPEVSPSPIVAKPPSVFPDPVEEQPSELPERPVSMPDPDLTARPEPEREPEPDSEPKGPKEPSKFERLCCFLAGRGFRWDIASNRFFHADGRFVHRSEGIFHWQLVAAGDVNPIWLASTSLAAEDGIELRAEVWNAARSCDAVLLSPEDGSYREHRFSTLRAEVDAQKLNLFPAAFRIRIPSEADESVHPEGMDPNAPSG